MLQHTCPADAGCKCYGMPALQVLTTDTPERLYPEEM